MAPEKGKKLSIHCNIDVKIEEARFLFMPDMGEVSLQNMLQLKLHLLRDLHPAHVKISYKDI